jgi:uncharacterized protein DUF547
MKRFRNGAALKGMATVARPIPSWEVQVMKPIGRAVFILFPCMLPLFLAFSADRVQSEKIVDHSLYAELLRKHVKDGVVDYRGIKNKEAALDRYLEILEKVDPGSLSSMERFAFYVNAYNAWTIKLILSAYPGVRSIKDLGSFFTTPWEKKICRINGELISLDNIEHDILRSGFKDPRIHFVVNCASRSCPPLRSEPYMGNVLDRQLHEMTAAFINDSRHNRLRGKLLYVSSIFKWYNEDFKGDVTGFFLRYAEGDLKTRLAQGREEIGVRYLDYDWSLNGE